MLKFKKLFVLGLMASVAGLFALGCTEDEEEVITSEVRVINVSGGGGAAVAGLDEQYLTTTFADEGDVVYLNYGIPPADQVFDKWTSSPSGLNITKYDNDGTYKFTMPGYDVTVTAVFKNAVDGIAEIMFTWKSVDQGKIDVISVNDEDVADWKDVVFNGIYGGQQGSTPNLGEYLTELPMYKGSAQLPGSFYVTTKAPYNGNGLPTNKSVSFDIDEGNYTAICTVTDPKDETVLDIVANYSIVTNKKTPTAGGLDKYYEVGFDVAAILDMQYPVWAAPGMGGFWSTTDPTDPPMLQKAKKPLVKTFTTKKSTAAGTIETTYYVLRRPTV